MRGDQTNFGNDYPGARFKIRHNLSVNFYSFPFRSAEVKIFSSHNKIRQLCKKIAEKASLSGVFEGINLTMGSLIIALSQKAKNLPISIILIGGIIIGLGLVFIAQSSSLLGPSSSFMYRNADWTTYGSVVVIIGIVVSLSGLLRRFVR
ncbi:MAG: hypothetical protein WBX01_00590 [Nitrososphaeraceae archaeon]